MSDLKVAQVNEGQEMPERSWHISRRGFLIGMAITGAAFALGIPLGLPVARRKIAEIMAGDFALPSSDLNPLLWLEVLPSDRIRMFVPKAEMGQGTHTALAQLAAEELEVRWDSLEVVHASSNQAEDKYRGTFGSLSILSLYNPVRQVAATMREMLRTQAALQLKQPPVRLTARDSGFEVVGDPKTRISYGALVGDKVAWQVPKKPVPLKPASEFKFIGQSMPRIDAPSKIKGKTLFVDDIRVEGMLYGAVVRPPTLEARMLSAQSGRAAGMPGVVKVVIEDGFAGIVAKSRVQAAVARDALEVTWDQGHLWQQAELEKIVTAGGPGGVTIQSKGNARSMLAKGTTLTAEYRTGFGAHATLETEVALANVNAKGGRVWTSTQWETVVAKYVAKALGIEQKRIEVIPAYVGGGFGRKADIRTVAHVAVEAARLSKATGAPVHVSWDRSEEMRHSFFRPITHHRLSAALDDKRRINAMVLEQSSGEAMLGVFPEFLGKVTVFDPGGMGGAWISYAIPHRSVTGWKPTLPILTGPWRGVGLFPNTFAVESFMDELAHAAGADPFLFRLDHLEKKALGQRMRAALNTAADLAGWGTSLPHGHARGIACCIWSGTVVAEVAEVSVNKDAGKIRVHKVVVAMDCGRAVNPNQVIAQVEGSVVMGTSATLIEEIIVKDGRVEAQNFDEYPLLRLSEAPEVETILLKAPDGRPRGVGEPAIGPVGASIANAFFALTGIRLRQLPMTPERVKKVLKV
jgi:isoquinoline 1-oxidoreductase beta subunit